jgi:DNA replication protein DnaC
VKSVRDIQSLASRSGELAGDAMQKNTVAKPSENAPDCPICRGTGWRQIMSGSTLQVARCDCFFEGQFSSLLAASDIPARYTNCTFNNFKIDTRQNLAAAKMTLQKWADQYPLDRTGLLVTGPSGVGKTHLCVSVLKQLIRKGIRCRFCDYRELLKQIQNSYNPSVQTTELQVLKPVFEAAVLLLDDLGAVKPSEWVWDTVSLVLNTRYNESRTTIITTNLADGPAAKIREKADAVNRATREETLGDRIGERMRSRLFEMCRLIQVQGEDYRPKFRSASFG